MPKQSFSLHVDPDALMRQSLAVAVPTRSGTDQDDDGSDSRSGSAATDRHGARDGRLAARQHSERAHAGRAAGAGGGRSYAFRRS
jgi:hypothetical protein